MLFSDIKPFVRFVRRLEINNNSSFPKSFPIDARLFYVTRGEGIIKINEEIITLPKGSVIFVNSGIVYRLMPCEAEYLAVNFDFTFDFSNLETPIPPVNMFYYNNEKNLQTERLDDAKCFNDYCFFDNFQSLQIYLLKLEKESTSKLSNYKSESSALMFLLLNEILRRAEARDIKDSRFKLEEILEYIEMNYSKPIDNRFLGELFHFHPNYISAEFKRITGKSLHQFVLETRILNGVSLMESGYDNIKEISELTGFCDSNYFSRYFKKTMGISPINYIKMCKEK